MVFQSAQGDLNGAVLALAANAHGIRSSSEDDVTLTVAQFVDALYVQGGTPGTTSKTTPTAAAIVAAIKGCAVGTRFSFIVDNGGDNTFTLVAGSGVTLSGTATVAAAKNKEFVGYVTNITASAEAVRVICMAQLA